MAHNVIMPKQGLQMTEGTIVKWLVAEGQVCEAGEPMLEIETDKITMTIDLPHSGVMLKIIEQEGSVVPVAQTIAIIGEEGEAVEVPKTGGCGGNCACKSKGQNEAPVETVAIVEDSVSEKADKFVWITPRAKMRAGELGVEYSSVSPSGPDGLIIERDILNCTAKGTTKATPLAKKIAGLNNVDVADIAAQGEGGKVRKADVIAHISAADAQKQSTRIKMTPMRKAIAKRMKESLDVHAQLCHTIYADMGAVIELRKKLANLGKKVSFNDIILLIVSRTLREFPMLNARIEGDEIVVNNFVNLGMAVDISDGLIVPNIKNADKLSLGQISEQSKALAQSAKESKLTGAECTGGTFTVSNLGMFGVDHFTAILNTPESGILALGAIKKKPVVNKDNEIVVADVMSMTLTYDHRIVDGAEAARFLARVEEYTANPDMLLW